MVLDSAPIHGALPAAESDTPFYAHDPSLSDLDKLRQLRKDILAGRNAHFPCPEHLKQEQPSPATRQQDVPASATAKGSNDKSPGNSSPAFVMDLDNDDDDDDDDALPSHVPAGEHLSTTEPQPQIARTGVSLTYSFSNSLPVKPINSHRNHYKLPSVDAPGPLPDQMAAFRRSAGPANLRDTEEDKTGSSGRRKPSSRSPSVVPQERPTTVPRRESSGGPSAEPQRKKADRDFRPQNEALAAETQRRDKLNRLSAPAADHRSRSRSSSLNTERAAPLRRSSRESSSQVPLDILDRRGHSADVVPRLERVSRSRSPRRQEERRRSGSPLPRRPEGPEENCRPRISRSPSAARGSRSRSPLPGVGPLEPADKPQGSSAFGEDSGLPHLSASQLSLQNMPRQQTSELKDGSSSYAGSNALNASAEGDKSGQKPVSSLSQASLPDIPLLQQPMSQSQANLQSRIAEPPTTTPKGLPQPRPGKGSTAPTSGGAKAASSPKTAKAAPKQNALSTSAPAGASPSLKERLSDESQQPKAKEQRHPGSASQIASKPANTLHRAPKGGQSNQDNKGDQRGWTPQTAAGPSNHSLDRREQSALLGRIDLAGQPVSHPPSGSDHRRSPTTRGQPYSLHSRLEARQPSSNHRGDLYSRISDTRRYSYDQSDRGSDATSRHSDDYRHPTPLPPYLEPSYSRPPSSYDYRYEAPPRSHATDHYSPERCRMSFGPDYPYNYSPRRPSADYRDATRPTRPPEYDSYDRTRRPSDDYPSHTAPHGRASPPRLPYIYGETYQPRYLEDQRRPPPRDGYTPNYDRSRPVRPRPYY